MKTELIKAIFTNLLFVIGVILIIIGFVRGTDTLAKTLIFDTYPLNTWEETRCEDERFYAEPAPKPVSLEETTNIDQTTMSDEELDTRFEKCEASLDRQRDTKQVSDTVGSVTMLISGIVLVYAFKGFIFTKK